MTLLYVREQGAVVQKRGGRILVEKNRTLLYELPAAKATAVAIFGNVQVTTQALSELLKRGIPLALFTRNGRLKGHLTPAASGNIPLRLEQYRAASDPLRALEIARSIVAAKLFNSAALLAGYRAHYPSPALASTHDALLDLEAKAAAAPDAASLMGFEGAGAAAYFEVFPLLNRSELPFPGRRRHPATDPLNALLSLGYTLLGNEIRALVEAASLEPFLGFLHRPDYNRPSLALDLLEPFRSAVADRLALRLVNERVLQPEDFATRVSGPLAGGVVLVPQSFDKYLAEYEQAMTQPRRSAPEGSRRAIQRDVENLAAAIRDRAPFLPFRESAPEKTGD